MFYGFQESSLKTITETIFKTGNWSIEKTQSVFSLQIKFITWNKTEAEKNIIHENVFSV